MGKKKTAIMDAEEKVFLYGNEKDRKEGEALVTGCIANGITEDAAKTVWEKMKKFALYAFNKSHRVVWHYIVIYSKITR